MNILLHFLILIVLLFQSYAKPLYHDNMCDENTIRKILCVKEILNNVSTTAKHVERKLNNIEKLMSLNETIYTKIENFGLQQMHSISQNAPKPKYHARFLRESNINQVCS